jgi:hypothetical protein
MHRREKLTHRQVRKLVLVRLRCADWWTPLKGDHTQDCSFRLGPRAPASDHCRPPGARVRPLFLETTNPAHPTCSVHEIGCLLAVLVDGIGLEPLAPEYEYDPSLCNLANSVLLNHLIGADEHGSRNRKIEVSRFFQIYDQFKCVGLLNRKILDWLPFQNSIDVGRRSFKQD